MFVKEESSAACEMYLCLLPLWSESASLLPRTWRMAAHQALQSLEHLFIYLLTTCISFGRQKVWIDDFPKRYTRYIKRCSTSLTIREMKINTKMIYYHTLVRVGTIKNTTNKYVQECRVKRTLVHCWWECKYVQPLWKAIWRFIK